MREKKLVVSNSTVLIALSEEIGADLVLVDDYWARKIAEYKGLRYTGTFGVLLKAKEKGIDKGIKTSIA